MDNLGNILSEYESELEKIVEKIKFSSTDEGIIILERYIAEEVIAQTKSKEVGKFRILSKEEVEKDRSNAYKYRY